MPPPLRIVLTGFMGSGKSTVGRLLAARLAYSFLDLDSVIEEHTGQTVPAIFAAAGEAAFRAHEHRALEHALAQSHAVIALGGGAVETAANHDLLRAAPDTVVVLLRAPFAPLFQRCEQQAHDPRATARPNLADRAQAESRFARRTPLYEAMAAHSVNVEALTAAEVVDSILSLLVS